MIPAIVYLNLDKMGEYKVQGNVAIITMKHPPMNSLNTSVRQAVYKYMDKASKDHMVSPSTVPVYSLLNC